MYRPLTSGVPSYFPAMLDDADRNNQYERAIAAAIARFVRLQGRPPVVVDLGCGTGMLTLFALRHGAARVVAVDINADVVGMCEHVVDEARKTEGAAWGPCDVVVDTKHTEPFDMLVTELFGTAGSSECQFEYVAPTLRHIRHFKEGVYCVPEQLDVTARWFDCSALGASESAGINGPLAVVLAATTDHWSGAGTAVLTNYLHTRDGILLHTMNPRPASDVMVLLQENYHTNAQRRRSTGVFQLTEPLGPTSFLVIEWKARLFGDILLENTMERYQTLSQRNAATRTICWGLLCARPFDTQQPSHTAMRLSITHRSNGVPKLKLSWKD